MDRRTRQTGPEQARPPAELFLRSALVPLTVLAVLAFEWNDRLAAPSVSSVIEVLTALVVVAGGVTLLVAWKIGGRAATVRLGLALIEMGVLSAAYHGLSALYPWGGGLDPYGRVVVCAAVVSTMVAALRGPEVDAGLRPTRVAGVTTLLSLAVLVVVAHLLWSFPSLGRGPLLGAVTGGGCAGAWTALAVLAWTRRGPAERPHRVWVGTFSLLQAAGAVMGALSPATGWGRVAVHMVVLTGASVALTAGATVLRGRLAGQDRYARELRVGLETLRGDLESERAELDERLHDLRNAVAALRSADTTLRRHASRLDDATRRSLADGLTAELARLQSLIEPGRRPRMQDFHLDSVLEPVVAAEATFGSTIRAAVGPETVHGDPDGLAQVVQNLLVNARRYAPETHVGLTAERLGGRVLVHIVDGGPGVGDVERAAIFGRGTRGRAAAGTTGSGLGLYVAQRLMAEMGGSLYLADGPGGAHFVAELQAGPTHEPIAPTVTATRPLAHPGG